MKKSCIWNSLCLNLFAKPNICSHVTCHSWKRLIRGVEWVASALQNHLNEIRPERSPVDFTNGRYKELPYLKKNVFLICVCVLLGTLFNAFKQGNPWQNPFKTKHQEKVCSCRWTVSWDYPKNYPEVENTRGEGNGTPLQYSCLENPMDGGAW